MCRMLCRVLSELAGQGSRSPDGDRRASAWIFLELSLAVVASVGCFPLNSLTGPHPSLVGEPLSEDGGRADQC